MSRETFTRRKEFVDRCHASARHVADKCQPAGTCQLPESPKTTSPVPELTSLHTKAGRGNYGDARFRGNCSGLLIRDLLRYYQPGAVLDPMTGSGTCRDVCRELDIYCQSFDLTTGFDARNLKCFSGLRHFPFVWLHPPYWKMVHYNDDPRCLSTAPTIDDFCKGLRQIIRNCLTLLSPTGRLAILMGDWKHQGHYLGLPFRTFNCAVQEGLWLDAPEIIRFQHGATSSSKAYNFAFIPRLHDVCFVLKRRP